jgi:peptidoglycan/LPS O-acetylase OafA/YrhL
VKKRIDVLDGLRGVAVLLVFLSHTSGRDSGLASFLDFKGMGHIGVYLFFTLSAFLLGLGVFSKPLDSKNIKAFFIKRTLRIIPLYYLVVTGVFLFQYYNQSYSPKYLHIDEGFNGYLQHLAFYRGDGVFWSIVSEMQFYVLVPLIAYIILKFEKKGMIFLSILAIFNFVIYLAKYAGLSDIILYFSPNTLERGTFIDIFLPGIILSYYLRKKREVIMKYEKQIHKAANLLFIGGGLLTFILVSHNFLGFNQPFYEFRFFSLIFGLAFSTITLSL